MGWLTRADAAASQRELGVIQTQLNEVVKDLAKLEARLDAHQNQHERDQRDRVTGRRWLIGTGVAMVAAMSAMLGTLASIAYHLH